MATSKRAKGNQLQDWIQKWLEERGWTVHNQKTVSRAIPIKGKTVFVSQRQDIFGCIDLICKKQGRKTLFIQATMHGGKGKKREDLKAVPWNNTVDDVQIWMDRGGKSIDIFCLDENQKDGTRLVGKILRRQFYAGERHEF